MAPKTIFICSNRSLFSEGIKTLLDEQPDLVVTGWECDPDRALRRIREIQPDVVLLVNSGNKRSCIDGKGLLQAGVKAVIVELNLNDSRVVVYRGELQTVEGVGDLVRVVEGFLKCSQEPAPGGGEGPAGSEGQADGYGKVWKGSHSAHL